MEDMQNKKFGIASMICGVLWIVVGYVGIEIASSTLTPQNTTTAMIIGTITVIVSFTLALLAIVFFFIQKKHGTNKVPIVGLILGIIGVLLYLGLFIFDMTQDFGAVKMVGMKVGLVNEVTLKTVCKECQSEEGCIESCDKLCEEIEETYARGPLGVANVKSQTNIYKGKVNPKHPYLCLCTCESAR